jgi:hypothetical protein
MQTASAHSGEFLRNLSAGLAERSFAEFMRLLICDFAVKQRYYQ